MRISDWSSDVCSSDLLLAQRLGPQLSRVVGESGGSCYGNGVFRRSVFAGAFLAVRFTGGFCARNAGTRSCCGLLKAGCTTTRESRSEEHTSELQSLMRISYAVCCLKKKKTQNTTKQLRKRI